MTDTPETPAERAVERFACNTDPNNPVRMYLSADLGEAAKASVAAIIEQEYGVRGAQSVEGTPERIWIHRSVIARDLKARGFGCYYPEPILNDVNGEGVEYVRADLSRASGYNQGLSRAAEWAEDRAAHIDPKSKESEYTEGQLEGLKIAFEAAAAYCRALITPATPSEQKYVARTHTAVCVLCPDHEGECAGVATATPTPSEDGAYSVESAWLPIESAPKDGTYILIWSGGWRHPFAGRYIGGSDVLIDGADADATQTKYFATHWMPLPIAPSPEAE